MEISWEHFANHKMNQHTIPAITVNKYFDIKVLKYLHSKLSFTSNVTISNLHDPILVTTQEHPNNTPITRGNKGKAMILERIKQQFNQTN